jgi:hypothetical protein
MKFVVILFILLSSAYLINTNPYSILGVAPYYSLKEIKEKYLELMTLNNPDKFSFNKEDLKTNFEKIQKAFEEIRETRNDEDEEDDGFIYGYFFAIKKCIWSIFFAVTIVMINYIIINIAYEIFSFTYTFLVIFIFILFPNEYFFAHLFENEETLYFFSLLISLVIVILSKLKKKYDEKKRKIQNENDDGKELINKN